MSQDSSESKNHAPTERRIRQARKRGQVPKSTELSTALSLLCTLLCVLSMAPWAAQKIAQFGLSANTSIQHLTLINAQTMVRQAMWLMAQLSLIPLSVAAIIFLFSLWLQTGTVFSFDLVQPQLDRLNPISGLKKLFSIRSVVQLALVVFKASIIASAALLIFFNLLGDAIRVIHADAGAALTVANTALMRLLLWCGGLFVMLGLLDLLYQRWQFLRELRMSTSEVRREHRDQQGDGQLKSERKNFAKETVPREQLQYIRRASLLLSDTQNRVVVLIYSPANNPLPFFLLRGQGEFAQEVTALAQKYSVPCVTDTTLLERLYPGVQTGLTLPAQHVDAVLRHIMAHTVTPASQP
jgi:flagellar biosynthesis protein FlhB